MWRYILQLERINILAETQATKTMVAFIIYNQKILYLGIHKI